MMETNSAPMGSERDGKCTSELKSKGVEALLKRFAGRVPKRWGRADDPPHLVDETNEVASPGTGAASVGVTLGAFEV
jgi:hypothetical protein